MVPWSSSSGGEQTTLVAYNNNSNNSNNSNRNVRVCSNPHCQNEETRYKPFKNCTKCSGRQAAYCSGKCRKQHLPHHLRHECTGEEATMSATGGSGSGSSDQTTIYAPAAPISVPATTTTVATSSSSSEIFTTRSPSSLSLAGVTNIPGSNNRNRRASDAFDMLDSVVQTGDTVHSSLSRTKRLSKYSSMNDNNNRRNSLNLVKSTSHMNDDDQLDNQSWHSLIPRIYLFNISH